MSQADVEVLHETEETRVINWRFDTLAAEGYSWAAATQVALRLEIDLHAAIDLLRRGCSEEIALRILL